MAVEITLFENGGQRFFLSGAENGKLKFNELHLDGLPTGNEVLTFASGEEFLIDKTLLEPISPGKFQFKPLPGGLTFSASLLIGATGKFFGRGFNVAGGISVQLIIRVPSSLSDDTASGPFFSVEVCGYVSLDTAPVEVSTEPLCFEVVLDQLKISLPVLHIKLPDIGIELPRFRVPWRPRDPIPSFPFTLPPLSISFPDLPIKVSWKSIRVEFDLAAKKLIIDIQQLRISGNTGAIEGDLHLVFKLGGIIVSESSITLTRPSLGRPVAFTNWFFDENCLLVTWKENQLTEWLRLLAPELADAEAVDDTEVALRLLRDRNGFREARLDWRKPAAKRVFNLLGFKVTFPAAEFYTLLFSFEDDSSSLSLYATLAKNSAAEAESTFSFGRFLSDGRGSRELLNDEDRGAGASPPVRFTAKALKEVSVTLMRVPLQGDATPRFFHQAEQRLVSLFDLFLPDTEKCAPTNTAITLKPIGEGWELKLDLNLPTGKPFTFPFLKIGQEQFVRVSRVVKKEPGDSAISCDVEVEVGFGSARVTTIVTFIFRWDRFSFEIKDDEGITFTSTTTLATTFKGMAFRFTPNEQGELFKLLTRNGDYRLQQANDSVIEADFGAATSEDSPIIFKLRDFSITGAGVSVKGEVTESPVLLNGVQTVFRFTRGNFEINHNRLSGFSIFGAGPLPPDLVGDAIVDIALQFEIRNDKLELIAGDAKLSGTSLLKCSSTRFEFSIEGVGLKFVNDGGYHFYFTITGRAKFVPLPIDEDDGPLSWLPTIEMQLLDCPLTTDMSVLAQHIKFVVELPEKKSFNFLGCFKMELRGIGFIPFTEFFDGAAAMQLAGQLLFADGADDVIESSIEFHSLYIGLPEPGSLFPRIHFKDLAVKVKKGDAFLLEGVVEYLDEIEEGLPLRGFAGRGSMEIQGLPTLTVAFSFVRIKRAEDGALLRAWFLYIQASKFNVKLPLYDIRLREIGLGFGYRYTLVSFKAIKGIEDNPRELIKKLQELSQTQGELSRRDQWSIDPEAPGQSVPWTVVARALFAQTAATNQLFEWNESKEAELACLFVMDVVLALRSDLTFLMTARAWLYTNYHDFLNDDSLREHPLVSGFALLQPKRKRLLAHFASNPGAEFGDHPPVPDYLKQAVNQSQFSATLLLEPGLLHYELGWPNMLRWKAKYGPLTAEFRGGVIFRLSRSEVVYGNSFLARGSLVLSAKAGNDTIGARLSATANVAFGARYIGVLGLQNPAGRSAIYGGVGVEINVRVLVEFWLRLKIAFIKININLHLEFSINFTASLEIGITAGKLVGLRGTASIGLSIMGRDLHFSVHVGFNESAVNEAFEITSQYLNIGFEATEVEPIPGTQSNQLTGQSTLLNAHTDDDAGGASPEAVALVADDAAPAPIDPHVVAPHIFITPHYTIFVITVGEAESFFVVFPNQNKVDRETAEGFLPVPPSDGTAVVSDFKWKGIAPAGENTVLKHFNPTAPNPSESWDQVIPSADAPFGWKANWKQPMGSFQTKEKGSVEGEAKTLTLKDLLNQAFIPKDIDGIEDLTKVTPKEDPVPPYERKQSSIEDARVKNPSDEAFEAAVRGAAEQFAGSPFFKRDPNSIYEQHLNNAFSPTTSIYSVNGETKPDKAEHEPVAQEELTQHVIQLRSMIVGQIIADLQKYVALEKSNSASKVADQSALIDKSIAFQMGLVFKSQRKDPAKEGGIPGWLLKVENVGVFQQRTTIVSPNADGTEGKIALFNTAIASFKKSPPQFQRVQHYTHANTVAITWDLLWPPETIQQFKDHDEKLGGDQFDPEHYLRHYHVRRISVSGGEREVEYEIKMGQCLNLPFIEGEMTIDAPNKSISFLGFDKVFNKAPQRVRVSGSAVDLVLTITKIDPNKLTFKEELSIAATKQQLRIISKELQPLRSRFQFVDHFNEETAEDQAALPLNGKSYIYTITPVDVTGEVSSRPLTIVATRIPIEAPAVPVDAQLIVHYEITPDSFTPPTGRPLPIKPTGNMIVRWTQPPEAAEQFRVGIKEYRLIFRKETAFPVGSYGLDSDSQGNSAKRLPPSGARKLRTDFEVTFKRGIPPPPGPDTEKGMLQAELELKEFAAIFPDGEWRPESWQVFLQTKSTSDVHSTLAPVRIALKFTHDDVKAERSPSRLEWITPPLALNVLPPEDERAAVGFAKVPMPTGKTDNGEKDKLIGVWNVKNPAAVITYHEHPERLRCLEFEWNQGPSASDDYPIELQAGYGLFEFNSDAHLWPKKKSDSEPVSLFDQMRRVQEIQLLPGDEATIRPATTLIANQWEAWYPSTTRRLESRQSPRAETKRLTPKGSDSVLSDWYSWRDSYLVWPDDQSMQTRDSDAEVACAVAGMMKIKDGAIEFRGLDVFKELQLVRVSGSSAARNNGIRTVRTVTPTKIEFVEGALKDIPGELLLLEGLFGSTRIGDKTLNLVAEKFVVLGTSEIDFGKQTLTNKNGGFDIFRPGQFVQISGAPDPAHNGVKQIVKINSDKELQFAPGSFPERPSKTVEKVDGRPFATLHPFLAQLIARLDNDPKIIVDLNPPPIAEHGDLNLMLAQSTPKQDPYGWNILKRMGLSVAFFLRDEKTGDYLTPQDAQRRLADAIDQIPTDAVKSHLAVEFLFQPARSVRLKEKSESWDAAHDSVASKDLLALIQISLRPALKQVFKYTLYEIQHPENFKETKQTVELKISTSAPSGYDLIDVSANTPPVPVPFDPANNVTTFEFETSARKPLVLLIRCAGDVKVEGSSGGEKIELTTLSPTDSLSARFGTGNWATMFLKDEGFFVNWHRGRRYLLRANPPSPSATAKFEVPLPGGPNLDDFSKLLKWLNRFFEHGGDVPTTDNPGQTAAEIWCAASYPRPVSPIGITPDEAGRLTYHHLIPDKWAHVYRYYFLPQGRYDALWKALADTFPASVNEKLESRRKTSQMIDIQAGGLDVVLDRIQKVAAPMVLFSGRLDKDRSKDTEVIPLGKIWEVIVAKHPEQRLVERNRTLVRQLDFRQIAHTLARQYAFLTQLERLDEAVSSYELIAKHLRFSEPPSLNLPEDFAAEPDLDDAALALDLTNRTGAFGTEALVLRWESLPYFYEHHLLLIAQTSRVASPVTEVVQREFEYQSPSPTAFAEGVKSKDTRKLLIRLPLNRHVDCAPDDVREQWGLNLEKIEKEKLTFAMLPDPGVIYQLVLKTGDLIETQAEIFFGEKKAGDKVSYYARQLGSKLQLLNPDQPVAITPPKATGTVFSDKQKLERLIDQNFWLEIIVEPKGAALVSNQQPVTSRHDFKPLESDNPEFPIPSGCSLVWDGAVAATELDELDKFQQGKDWDNSFANAFAQLVDALRTKQGEEVLVQTEALVGLDQLIELSKDVILPTDAQPSVTWIGTADERQVAGLKKWGIPPEGARKIQSEYGAVFTELLKQLKQKTIESSFVPDGGKIPTQAELPAELRERLTTGNDKSVWKRLDLSAVEAAKLAELIADGNLSLAFRSALKKSLDEATVTVEVKNYKPRPRTEDLQPVLRPKLLLGNAVLSVQGWMTRDTARKLLDQQLNRPPNQKSIRRLFNDSVSGGLGGTLSVTARLGTATLVPGKVIGNLE